MSEGDGAPLPSDNEGPQLEFPPGEGVQEYTESFWFITEDGKVVVQPPHGDELKNDEDEPAYVWKIDGKISNKTLSHKSTGKREALIIQERALIRAHYRNWTSKDTWTEDERVSSLFKDASMSTTILKSNLLCLNSLLA
jgi:hypothetical protein